MRYVIRGVAAGLVLSVALAGFGCKDGQTHQGADQPEPSLTDAKKQAVVDRYAELTYASYRQTLEDTTALRTAVRSFTQAPSPERLEAAKRAWLTSRDSYGQTEVFRFYGGPIDDADAGVEGQLNAWPLDEAYIDYVEGNADAGLINDAGVELSRKKLVELNEKNGEKNISTGYHAIEFLLWGQDSSDAGPGQRPHTDYVVGDEATAQHPKRRAQYLELVADQLVDDSRYLVEEWKPGKQHEGAKNYRAEFVSTDPDKALQRMLTGMGMLSGAELSGERMEVALENRDQEDEQSCFSDNTHNDIIANAVAVQNVYLGRFGDQDGPGLDTLVAELDPALDEKLTEQLQASIGAARAIPQPFDRALQSEQGRAKIRAAIDALRAQTETIVQVADLLGIRLNLA